MITVGTFTARTTAGYRSVTLARRSRVLGDGAYVARVTLPDGAISAPISQLNPACPIRLAAERYVAARRAHTIR